MGFLKFLLHSIGNLIIFALAFLFLGAGIFPFGYQGNLDEIATHRAVMVGIGIILTIYLAYRQRRQSKIDY